MLYIILPCTVHHLFLSYNNTPKSLLYPSSLTSVHYLYAIVLPSFSPSPVLTLCLRCYRCRCCSSSLLPVLSPSYCSSFSLFLTSSLSNSDYHCPYLPFLYYFPFFFYVFVFFLFLLFLIYSSSFFCLCFFISIIFFIILFPILF